MPIFKSKYPDIVVPDITVTQLVFQDVSKEDEAKVLYVDAFGDKSVTFREFRDLTFRIAKGLYLRNLKKGEVVGIVSPNTIYYPSIFHGIMAAGGIATTANPHASNEDLAKQLQDSNTKVIFTIPELEARVKESLKLANLNATVVYSLGSKEFQELLHNDGTLPSVNLTPQEHLAMLPYSSGTTGFPKGVMITHRAIIANVFQLLTLDIYEGQ